MASVSVGDVLTGIQIIYAVAKALSEVAGAKGQVAEDMVFLERLDGTLEDVQDAIKQGVLSEDKGLRDKLEAIRKPVEEVRSDMERYGELRSDRAGGFRCAISRSWKKFNYVQIFSGNIASLRDKVAVPLTGLHMSITIKGLGNARTHQELLETWVAVSKKGANEEHLRDVKVWLRPEYTVEDTYNTVLGGLDQGTCEWLFSKQEYIRWRNHLPKRSSSLLWVSGIPGAGKTNLAAKTIDRLQNDERTVAYFFCDGTAQRSNLISVLATLCWELLNQFSEDVDLLSEAYNKGVEPTEKDMRKCLGKMCERRDVVILLDGLDECASGHKEKVCDFLVNSASRCDVVVFSREHEDIKEGLSQVPGDVGMVRITISESDTRNDLQNFILKSARKFPVSKQKTREEIVRRLQAGCQGMFQWATQMIEQIIDSDGMADKEFLSETEKMPTDLHHLYLTILGKIHEDKPRLRKRTMSVLYWVALAGRALSLPEIWMMLEVQGGELQHGNDPLPTQKELRERISSCCGSLVRFVTREGREVVVVAHASVKEFLFRLNEHESMVSVSCTEAEIEAELAHICLTYLCYDDIEPPPFQIEQRNESKSSLEAKFKGYLNTYPLMDYAATNAWPHASNSAAEPTVQAAVKRFCSSEILTIRWLQIYLRLRGELGLRSSNDASDDINAIERACNFEGSPSEVSRWLAHLQGPSHNRFSRWRRFVNAGSANDFLPALHVAAFFDFDEYVDNELQDGADPNERSLEGQRPLHLAARGDSVACGEVLLAHGADVDAPGWSGTSPLNWAVPDSHEFVHFLVDRGADPNGGKRYSRYQQPLIMVMTTDPPDSVIIEKLLNAGAFPSPVDRRLWNTLHHSVNNGALDRSVCFTKILLENGADYNAQSDSGSMPLHVATQLRNRGAMELLIAKHERDQLNTEDELGKTPFMIAVENNYEEEVQMLLDAGSSMESSLWQVKQVGQNSYKLVEKEVTHYPRSKEDQYRVYAMLQGGANRSRLPAHIVRKILDQAEYWVKSTFVRGGLEKYNQRKAGLKVPYILSDPIDGTRHFPVRKITLATRSRDQGWSDFKHQHNTYHGSCTWFDFVVHRPDGSERDDGENRCHVITNLHACKKARVHSAVAKTTPSKERASWIDFIEPGDRVGVLPFAEHQGWVNHVFSMRVEVFSTFILGDDGWKDTVRHKVEEAKIKILKQMKMKKEKSGKETRFYTEELRETEKMLKGTSL